MIDNHLKNIDICDEYNIKSYHDDISISDCVIIDKNKIKKEMSNSCNDSSNNIGTIQFFQTIYDNNFDEFRNYFVKEDYSPWDWLEEDHFTCLHRACYLNLYEFVKIIFEEMIKREIDSKIINNLVNKSSMKHLTAIHLASYRGNIEIIKILIKYGADIYSKNDRGLNVLHMTAQGDQPAALIYFREKHGMDLEEVDLMGNTPLHWASYMGSESFIKIILSYRNLNVNCQECQGLTPLHLAVMSEKTKIIKNFLYYGANKNLKDKKQRTAYELAIDKNKFEIAEMIKDDRFNYSYPNLLNNAGHISSNKKKSYSFVILFIIIHLVTQSITFLFIIPHYYNTIIGYVYLLSFLTLLSLYTYACRSNSGSVSNPLLEKMKKIETSQISIPNCKHSRISHKLLLKLTEDLIAIEHYCPYCVVPMNDKRKIKHCFNCDVCVEGFDHHCFWINNCVGDNNIIIFIVFLSYVLLNLLMHIVITFYLLVIFNDSVNSNEATKNSNNLQQPASFPPFYQLFKKLHLYEKDVKIILSGIVMIISISFLVPVLWLWSTNIKAIMKFCNKDGKRPLRRNFNTNNNNNNSFFSNLSKYRDQNLSDEEENLMKTRA